MISTGRNQRRYDFRTKECPFSRSEGETQYLVHCSSTYCQNGDELPPRSAILPEPVLPSNSSYIVCCQKKCKALVSPCAGKKRLCSQVERFASDLTSRGRKILGNVSFPTRNQLKICFDSSCSTWK